MITAGYCTLVEFQDWIGEDPAQTDHGTQHELAVESASRAIDNFCGVYPGTFILDTAATAQTYLGCYGERIVAIDPLGETSSAIVKWDAGADGTFETTLTVGTNFVFEPSNAIAGGWPVTRIRLVDGSWFPYSLWGRDNVQVTGKWGWPTVPAPVKQACLLVASELWQRSKTPFGVLQNVDFGPIRLSSDAFKSVSSLLASYRQGDAFPQA